jgi:hypothetical protein
MALLITATRFVHGNQRVARDDHATTRKAVEPFLRHVARSQRYGFATTLARDRCITDAIRAAVRGNFTKRSALRLRQLSGTSVGQL